MGQTLITANGRLNDSFPQCEMVEVEPWGLSQPLLSWGPSLCPRKFLSLCSCSLFLTGLGKVVRLLGILCYFTLWQCRRKALYTKTIRQSPENISVQATCPFMQSISRVSHSLKPILIEDLQHARYGPSIRDMGVNTTEWFWRSLKNNGERPTSEN